MSWPKGRNPRHSSTSVNACKFSLRVKKSRSLANDACVVMALTSACRCLLHNSYCVPHALFVSIRCLSHTLLVTGACLSHSLAIATSLSHSLVTLLHHCPPVPCRQADGQQTHNQVPRISNSPALKHSARHLIPSTSPAHRRPSASHQPPVAQKQGPCAKPSVPTQITPLTLHQVLDTILDR